MSDKALLIYQLVTSIIAGSMLVATAFGLMLHEPWVATTASILIIDCVFILITAIPVVYLNDLRNGNTGH